MYIDFTIHKGVMIFHLSDFYKPVLPLKLQLETGLLHERKGNIITPGYRN